MRYPFVLFDVGDTLISPRRSYGSVYAEVLGDSGLHLDAERLDAAIRQVVSELREEIPPGVDRYTYYPGGETAYWLRFSRRAVEIASGRPCDDAEATRHLEALRSAFKEPAVWRVYDDVRPALDALRAAGCHLAVASNWDSRLPLLLERLDLASLFEVIGVSAGMGVEKPNPTFFRKVLADLGAPTEKTLHVGNSPELDIAGARAAGMNGFLVDRSTGRGLAGLPELVAGC